MRTHRSAVPSSERRPRGLLRRTPLTLAAALLCVASACSSRPGADTYLTYTAESKPHAFEVTCEGALSTKVAQVLQAPRIRYQPEIAFLAPEGTAVGKGDVVARLECQPLETAHVSARNELALARAEAVRVEAEQAMQRALLMSQINSSEASGEISRLQVSRMAFVAPRQRQIESLKLEKARLKTHQLQEKLRFMETIHEEERTHARLKVAQAERKLTQAAESLEKLALNAPVDGVVVHETSWRSGEKVQEGDALYPGMPVVKIPDLSTMQVTLQVGEIEAQRLKVGQEAAVTVPSVGPTRLPGKVASVARRAQPVKRGSKVKRVEVTVSLDSLTAGLTPGLTASATVVVDARGEALTVPMECVFDRDSVRVVYVRRGDGFEARPVSVTANGRDFAVIEGAVPAGARLALREPDAQLIHEPDGS